MAPISTFSAIFPPSPTFTDANLPSLTGKVYIVTGAASGVGFEVAKILYLAGGTVYIAARSESRCEGAISKILNQTFRAAKGKKGRLESMVVDLSDLKSVKTAAAEFLKREEKIDVLIHNAAVMTPPEGSKDKLGHDLEIGTNCLAPYLLTLLLEPLLIRAATSPGTAPYSVRIVWVTSLLQPIFGRAIPPNGMNFQPDGTPEIIPSKDFMANYMQSKVGDAWLATHFAEKLGKHGIMSVSLHPGLMRTELQRHWGLVQRLIMSLLFKGPVYGAYSELYAGLSPAVKVEQNGGHLMAWGRAADLPDHIIKGMKSKAEGGTGASKKFFEYCDREIKDFL